MKYNECMKMRKLFGTDGIRGKANAEPMTPITILGIGQAFAKVLYETTSLKNGKPKIILGKDTRISGYIFETALTSGLCSMGVDVYLIGPLPTPAIAHLVKSFGADGGIMITASHNPAGDNGIKFFGHDGYKLSDDVEELIERKFYSEELTPLVSIENLGKAYRINDAKGRYIEFAKASINNVSLEGVSIILDCANGAAYDVAPLIFSELRAKVTIVNNKPDGFNINKECGALHPEKLSEEARKKKCIGLTFDGDADRVVMVDEEGDVVDGDEILAIVMQHLLPKNKVAGRNVVVTTYSNLGFDDFIKSIGGEVSRVENGDRYVIEEMRRKGYNLGGEKSGHIIFGDYTTTGDGIIAALQILRIMKEKNMRLHELKQCMKKYPQVLINVNVKEKIPLHEIDTINDVIKKVDNRMTMIGGRAFVRYSGTENVCRILAEGKNQEEISLLANEIADVIKGHLGA